MDGMTTAPLHVDMDALTVGPVGETLGILKQAVRDARSDFLRSLLADGMDSDEGGRLLLAYQETSGLLNDAYELLGLPYEAP